MDEENFLTENKTEALKNFETTTNEISINTKKNILSSAATQNKKAQN